MIRALYVGPSALFQGEVLEVDFARRSDGGQVVGVRSGFLGFIPMAPSDLVLERGPHEDATEEAARRCRARLAREYLGRMERRPCNYEALGLGVASKE